MADDGTSGVKDTPETQDTAAQQNTRHTPTGLGGAIGSAFNWAGKRFSAFGSNVSDSVRSISNIRELPSAIKNGVVSAASAVGNAGSWVLGKIGDGASWAGDKISYAVTHPGETFSAIGNGLATAGQEFIKFQVYNITHPGRALGLAAQGLTNGVMSTVGFVGDVGKFLVWDQGIRRGVNMFYTDDEKIPHSRFGSWTEGLVNSTTFIRPRNNYERVTLFGTQAAVEVAAFVGVTVATAGTGSAAWAAARGGAYAARGASFARATGLVANTTRAGQAFWTAAQGASSISNSARVAGSLGRGVKTATHGYRWSLPLAKTSEGWKVSKLASAAEIGGFSLSFGFNFHSDLKEFNTADTIMESTITEMVDQEIAVQKAETEELQRKIDAINAILSEETTPDTPKEAPVNAETGSSPNVKGSLTNFRNNEGDITGAGNNNNDLKDKTPAPKNTPGLGAQN